MLRHKNRKWGLFYDDMILACKKIISYSMGYKFEQFEDDEKTKDATLYNIGILGEALKYIPETITAQIPEIPWTKISATRNRFVHEYFGANDIVIWEIVQFHVPNLLNELEKFKQENSDLFNE